MATIEKTFVYDAASVIEIAKAWAHLPLHDQWIARLAKRRELQRAWARNGRKGVNPAIWL